MAESGRARVADWLLVPGWGFAASAFDEVRAALPASLRAEAVACRDALAAIGRRVAAVQAGEAEPFGVCAWSLGATIALGQAARCPGAFAALVVTGATPRFVACDDWPHAMPATDFDAFATLAAASPTAAQSRLAALCTRGAADAPTLLRRLRRSFDRRLPAAQPGDADAAADARGPDDGGDTAFGRALMRDLDCLRGSDLRERLATLALPVTVVHGVRDALVPAEAARIMCGLLQRATWVPVSDDGHALPFTRAPLLAATIMQAAGLQGAAGQSPAA
jgi:pimeloyl-[acyl-carrier protein] methyl ester esterase